MALEISGRLNQYLPEVSGTGKNGTAWTKRDFVIETADNFPKKICISAWGDKTAELNNIGIGEMIKVSFDVQSREYNGKWYTDLRAWKIERIGAASQSSVQTQEPGSFDASPEGESPADDLPF
ncbi:MAG: DUF3127 domain-containing protein [Bacteroidales bacterium]